MLLIPLKRGRKTDIGRLITAFAMGMNSGLVYALLGSTLTAYLTDLGVSLTLIGFLSLRTLPYSFKFVWAPFLDKHKIKIPSLNLELRKSWMISMQILLLALISFLGFIDLDAHFALFCIVTVLIAFIGATFDISMDAYRIELFSKNESLVGNSKVIIGFRLGLFISAALALYLSAFISWKIVFVLVALSLIPLMLVIYYSEENKTHKEATLKKRDFLKEYFLTPMHNLLSLPKAYVIFMLIVFYKLSDGYVDVMLIPFLEDVGFSKEEIAVYSKTIGIIAGMLGTIAGAFFLQTFSILSSLFIAEVLAALSNLTFVTLIKVGKSDALLMFVSFLESFCSGICNLALITYMSSLCNRRFTATHFALLMSISSFGRILLSSASGLIASHASWVEFFIFSSTLSIPSLLCIFLLVKNERAAFKNQAITQ